MATMAESSEILLQIIPLKVIGNNGKSITRYGLADSGSDVTMIDPSLMEQLEIQGEASQLFLSTVNQREKMEQGVKVNFKIASVANQDAREIAVRNMSRSAREWDNGHIYVRYLSLKLQGTKCLSSLVRMSRTPSYHLKSGKEPQTGLLQ